MKYKKIILLLLIATLITTFTACNVQFNTVVNFFVDDQVYYSIEADNETVLEMPPNPTKDGYTFVGWYWDKDVWNQPLTVNSLLDAPIADTFSIFAYFTPAQTTTPTQRITISFVADGIVYDDISNDGKSIVYLPIAPAKSGHTFEGWFFDQGTWQKQLSASTLVNSPETEDFSVYAYFKPIQPTTNHQIAVSFFVGDIVIATVQTDGKSIVELPTEPKKSKHTFEGWYFDNGVWSQQFVADTLVNSPESKNLKVYAYFKPVPVEITFSVDQDVFDTILTDGKSTVSLPTPRKGGYDFLGWFYQDGSPFVANTLVSNPTTDNFTVFAKFSPIADLYVVPSAVETGNTFKTITAALNAAQPNQTIFVSAGIYPETLVIDKPVTLLGNNYDVQGDGNRFDETIVTIGTDIGDNIYAYLFGYSQNVINITSTGVVVKGLTIDGNNPSIQNVWSLSRQQALFGTGEIAPDTSKYYSFEYLKDFYGRDVGVDAAAGIYVDVSTTNTLTIENNIIKNFWQFGISSYNTTVDSSISGNKISNILPMATHYKGSYWGAYGDAISVLDGGNGLISYNTIVDCKVAIQIQSNNASVVVEISNNTLLNNNIGIWLNHTLKEFDIKVKDNVIVYGEGKPFFSPSQNFAIASTNLSKGAKAVSDCSVKIDGNTIENYNFGLGLGSINEGANMVVSNNSFKNINSACIGTFEVLLGYTMNKPVYVTLNNNAYNGLNKFSFQNIETVATGDF